MAAYVPQGITAHVSRLVDHDLLVNVEVSRADQVNACLLGQIVRELRKMNKSEPTKAPLVKPAAKPAPQAQAPQAEAPKD